MQAVLESGARAAARSDEAAPMTFPAMTPSGNERPIASQCAARRPWRSARLAAAAALVFGVFGVSAAFAAPPRAVPGPTIPAQCRVPDDTALIDGPLPRLAGRLKTQEPLTIVVIGSGSAAGSGTSNREAAFPSRLEVRFRNAFGKAKTRLVVLAEMGQTAPSMNARIARDVLPLKPALVVWQTGSADAARGVPVTEFGNALEHGIGELREQGSDVLLVDSQFSPRASLIVNTDAYRDAVRWNARRFDLPLFKRYDTMQYWWSHEVFDLDAEGKAAQLANADVIHDCVAALLVRAIERGVAAATKS